MHQYPIPYAGPPHVHCRGMIDMQAPEWTGANGMPPGLGLEWDAASDVYKRQTRVPVVTPLGIACSRPREV